MQIPLESIQNVFAQTPHDGPLLVLDLKTVANQYDAFKTHLPYAHVFYAIKANAEKPIVDLLASKGSSFDAASINEIRLALAAGATPDRISYGNTIKKERDIAEAYKLGVRIFAYDCMAELEKIARVAPDAKVYCRLLCDCVGAAWPLSRKFGCTPEMAKDLLTAAQKLGLTPWGLSFHVGSQQQNTAAWHDAITMAAGIFNALAKDGINLQMLNMGGGFPAHYNPDVPPLEVLATSITNSLNENFPQGLPTILIEPGRAMVAACGIIRTEVVLISQKSDANSIRWVYLDIGLFSGLTEVLGEALRFPFMTEHDGGTTSPAVLAGPTCDSADILYEKNPIPLPNALQIGDQIFLLHAGAYTTSYATKAFNGFDPVKAVCI